MTNRNKAVNGTPFPMKYFSDPFYAETFIIDFSEKNGSFLMILAHKRLWSILCRKIYSWFLGINHGNFVVWFHPFTSGQGKCFIVVFELPLEGLFLPSKQLTNRIIRQISQAKKRSKFTRSTAEELQEGSKSLWSSLLMKMSFIRWNFLDFKHLPFVSDRWNTGNCFL